MPKRRKKVSDPTRAEILKLLAQGYTANYVARKHGISQSQVKKIKKDALRKEEQKQLEEITALFRAQLFHPAPETVLIDNLGNPGSRSIPLNQDVFRITWENTGYDTSVIKVVREKPLAGAQDEVNVVVLPDGNLELFCPVEKDPLFAKLLSSLSPTAQEYFSLWKPRGGEYLAMCTNVRRHIHADTNDRHIHLFYEIGRDTFAQIGRYPPV
jgi:hypothetical protein